MRFGPVSLGQCVASVKMGVAFMGRAFVHLMSRCICHQKHHARLSCTQGLFKGLSGFQLCTPAMPGTSVMLMT